MQRVLVFTFCLLILTGCTPAPYLKPQLPPEIGGFYHRVEKGQTLWRISRIYGVDLKELARVNQISDKTKLEIGESIFIPKEQKTQFSSSTFLSEDFIWPTRGRVIATFGQVFENSINKGINIEVSSRGAEVVASRSGRVVFLKEDFLGYGKTIIIEHPDGFLTVYARNSEIFVQLGDTLKQGNLIAKVNRYLHFEIRKGHLPQNPYLYLP